MRPEGVPIQALLWRTFTPAIVVLAVALGTLVYTRLYDTILDGFARKLVTTSSLTGVLIDPADHDWLIDAAMKGAPSDLVEATPRYRRNVLPLRRIRRELGLTYLYSQVLGGSKDVVYVVDGTEGSEHSEIGSEDELTAETRAGLREVQAKGTVYVSPIEFQEQWGLLKTAAAPMRAVDGHISASAGADVNIGVIHVATQNAVFASALIGVASLIASALVTLVIMRRVAQPIEALKADALRIAAGDRAPPTNLRAPREVERLRIALGELANQLVGAMRAARADALGRDAERNLGHLGDLLSHEPRCVTLTDTPGLLVAWIGAGDDAASGLEARAMRRLADRIAGAPVLAADAAALAAGAGGAVLVHDRDAGRIANRGQAPAALRVDGREVRIEAGAEIDLAPAAALEVVTAQGWTTLSAERPR